MTESNSENVRIAKQVTKNGLIEISPLDIKAGMYIRLYEPDGTPVLRDGNDVFIVETDAFLDEDGIVFFRFAGAIKG